MRKTKADRPLFTDKEANVVREQNHNCRAALMQAISVGLELFQFEKKDEANDLIHEAIESFKLHCIFSGVAIAGSDPSLDLSPAQREFLRAVLAEIYTKWKKHQERLDTLGEAFTQERNELVARFMEED